jgi:hypothetical protein
MPVLDAAIGTQWDGAACTSIDVMAVAHFVSSGNWEARINHLERSNVARSERVV